MVVAQDRKKKGKKTVVPTKYATQGASTATAICHRSYGSRLRARPRMAWPAHQGCMGRRPNEGPGRARPGGRPGTRRPQSVPDAPEMSVSISKGTKPGSVSAAPTHRLKKYCGCGGAEIHYTSLLISKKNIGFLFALTIKAAVCFLRNIEEDPHINACQISHSDFYCTVTFFVGWKKLSVTTLASIYMQDLVLCFNWDVLEKIFLV
jgi:hypothetical protein